MKFEAQVFVNNELKQKVLRAPSNFKTWTWTESWRVFRTAMVCLKAAAPQTLDDYFRGVEQLTILYPHAWGLVFCADELMRSEGWDKIREELEDDQERPETLSWDAVIRMSTYGRGDAERQHWRFTHVVAPATSGGGGRTTVALLDGSSALPSEDGLFTGDAKKGGGKNVPCGRRGGTLIRKGSPPTGGKGGWGTGAKGSYYDDYGWDYGKSKGKNHKGKNKNRGRNDKGGKGKSSEPSK